MDANILLSLCVPTNGVIEWVVPVLDSIYADKVPLSDFEVIVTDNGKKNEFAALMSEYEKRYDNLIYVQTEAVQFQNQIEAFKLAKGSLIKFVNHRMVLLPGTLNYLIQYARENSEDKPTTYFSNGELKNLPEVSEIGTFDEYVRKLSYYSSWSAGTTMWKTEFEMMDKNMTFNRFFPHIDMVFFNRTGTKYKIVNKVLMSEISVDDTKKGRYDLFDAFAYEYVRVLESLYSQGHITKRTFDYVKKENRRFVAGLYYRYVVRKQPCSYELGGFNKAVGHYYSWCGICVDVFKCALDGLHRRVFGS